MITHLAAMVLALACLGACVIGPLGVAIAGPVPDDAHLALMRQAIEDRPLVRVSGDFGSKWARHPWIDSSGVWLEPKLSGRSDAMLDMNGTTRNAPVPWQQISSLQTDRATTGQGLAIGTFLGLAFGTLVAVVKHPLESDSHNGAKTIGVSTAIGAGIGLLLALPGKRRTIYPVLAFERH